MKKLLLLLPALFLFSCTPLSDTNNQNVSNTQKNNTNLNISIDTNTNQLSMKKTNTNVTTTKTSQNTIALISTKKGIIKIELADKDAPLTVANFKELVAKKFYDGLTFHRIEPGFVIQGGDPRGNGTGGSDKAINLEIYCTDGTKYIGEIAPETCTPVLMHKKGAIAMARTNEPNSATSQFYITLDNTSFLDRNYAVFGYVVEGMDVVEKIQKGDTMTSIVLQ